MIYFISDLHLCAQRPQITQAFYHFLNTQAKDADALYILGDFFERWLGDDDDTPVYRAIMQALQNYSARGTQLFVMRGNRDFLLGKDFAQSVGAKLLEDPTPIQLNQHTALLMHGDSLCTDDQAYMDFRKTVRDPLWQQAILAKPLSERKAIAAHMRASSHAMNSLKAADIMDVNPSRVQEVMLAHQTPLLIHGHTHRPARHSLSVNGQSAERIVLGDWDQQGWYLCVDQQKITLRAFDISASCPPSPEY
ncbi:MAG: UDP-2,3-diacylglucosamine diphosphatase [Cellvibrionaceae bacterium]|nr:UDP-2,3-diacylglucosamine diphosphatase [Cellvibrionaceae bacterium]